MTRQGVSNRHGSCQPAAEGDPVPVDPPPIQMFGTPASFLDGDGGTRRGSPPKRRELRPKLPESPAANPSPPRSPRVQRPEVPATAPGVNPSPPSSDAVCRPEAAVRVVTWPPRACVVCGVVHRRHSPYCSVACRQVAAAGRPRVARRVAVCERCSREWLLPALRRGAVPRFCSAACRYGSVRRCEVCDVSSLAVPGRWRRWCSPACRLVARERALSSLERPRKRRPLRRPPQRFCAACGTPFAPKDRRHYFCGAVCRERDAWYRRPVPQRRAKSRRQRDRAKETNDE